MKEKQKPIILEVEPLDHEDSDTSKRLLYCEPDGFTHAESIGYKRISLATNDDLLNKNTNDKGGGTDEK